MTALHNRRQDVPANPEVLDSEGTRLCNAAREAMARKDYVGFYRLFRRLLRHQSLPLDYFTRGNPPSTRSQK